MIVDSKMSTHQPSGVLQLKDFINWLVLSYEQMGKEMASFPTEQRANKKLVWGWFAPAS